MDNDVFSSVFSLCPCGIWAFALSIQFSAWGIALFLLFLWVLFLADALKRPDSVYASKDERLIWVLILILTGWIGIVLYYFLIYRKYGKAL